MAGFTFLTIWLIGIGVLGLVLWRSSNSRLRRPCPGCNHTGCAAGMGRFQCTACQRVFFLNYRGRVVPSLATAILPMHLITGSIILCMIAFQIGDQKSGQLVGTALIVLLNGLSVYTDSQTKPFPNADAG